MAEAARPIFATFDEAWQWFMAGGALVPIDQQREGFVRGRAQFLSFQVQVGEMAVAEDIAALQDTLADIDGLSLIPPELLHISIRGVGFQVIANPQEGDVLRQDVGAIAERAAKALRGAKPVDALIGPVNVFPDALILEVAPVDPMRDLLYALDATRSPNAFPYPVEKYLPHVTIASFIDTSGAASLRERLPALRERAPLTSKLDRIDLARWWFTGHDSTAWPEVDIARTYRLK